MTPARVRRSFHQRSEYCPRDDGGLAVRTFQVICENLRHLRHLRLLY
jgi:hypothetical protein